MSSGLMSCVRENSPPLELDLSASGPLSLPEGKGRSSHGYQGHPSATSTPIASPQQQQPAATTTTTALDGSSTNVEQQQQQQKRRRFHPLRNLRRIFRRRTINSADSAAAAAESQTAGSCNTLPPPASSASEKNLRSIAIAGVSCSSSTTEASASSPASPHDNSYQTQSLPKSKSYGAHRDELLSVLLGKKRASKQQQEANNHQQPQVIQADAMYQTQRPQQMGVAVFPVDTMGMSRNSYYAEKRLHQRQLLRSTVGDSSQDLLDAEDSGAVGVNATDMSDSQRSLSEARLLDVDGSGYTRETLSQSHDSVFSESATASSLSIVLKAELTDVLRKRRNRPDASDEDLGLPRSPVSPQRLAGAGQSRKANSYQSRSVTQSHEASSSLSLLSVNSTDNEDNSQSHRQQHTSSLEHSSSSSVVLLRDHHNEDDVDAVGVERQRLSHAAAKHKMAIRPIKKKGPTRQHRRTLETSIPEANEELVKQAQNPNLRALKDADLKTKTRSLPPGSSLAATNNNNSTRNKTIEQKSSTTSSSSHTTTTTTTSTSTSSSSSQAFGLRALTFKAANALFDGRGESSTDVDDSSVTNNTTTSDSSEPGFLRRLIHRNSKRSIARANDGLEDVDSSQNSAKKLQISTSCLEAASREPVQLSSKSRSATSHEQNIQETRQIIKREIHNEGKHGLNAMVSNYGVQPQPPTPVKPKSGPAARQRYMPQELGATTSPSDSDVTNLLSRSSRGNDTFQSTSLVREQTQLKSESSSSSSSHFERKPRIVGLSAFQQKLSRSSDSMGQHSSSPNSLETSTDEPSPLYYEEKQRKTVEKARSFRNYQEERDVIIESASMHSNMPSLPDLSLSFRVPTSYYKQQQQLPQSPLTSPLMSPNAKCVSLGFEINDNKLLQSRAESTGKLQQTKLSPQRNSTLLVTTPLGPANITQIEQNIDLIVKSPMVSLLRKSGNVEQQQQTSLPQRPKVLELKQTTTIAIGSPGKDMASPLAKNAKLSSSPPPTSPPSKNNQPEFMKIQLNRVDQARLHSKTNHLVLAKNVKSPTTPAERSQSSDDLSMRRLSKEVPATPAPQTMPIQSIISQPTGAGGAGSLIKQQRAVSANSLRSSYVSSSGSSSNGSSEVLVTPPKIRPVESIDLENTNANRFSLEERKRLFLSEEKTQAAGKLTERKKSNSEEGQKTPSSPITQPSSPEGGNGNAVVLRKKSFGSSNGSSNSSTNGNPTGHDDPTPELMKVFARRSLKVKDDDVTAMAQIAVANHKKITNGSQSIDSDKENQSNSEEKLDKIPEPAPKIIQVHSQSAVANNNRSSVADFRNLNNNNVQQAAQQQKLTNLPPIKVSNVRNNNNSNKNNNSNNSNNNSGVKHPNERYSLQLKSVTATTPTVATATIVAISTAVADAEVIATPTKPIERSATVGEFKGIHQRRAEWEQRVKEALK